MIESHSLHQLGKVIEMLIITELLENIAGITDEDKKDLVHWMTYREKRPPSPSPQEIIEKIQKPSPKEKDRFSECKIRFFRSCERPPYMAISDRPADRLTG